MSGSVIAYFKAYKDESLGPKSLESENDGIPKLMNG